MARSNYQTYLSSPTQGGNLSSPSFTGVLRVANAGTSPPASSSGFYFRDGVYSIETVYNIDSENVTFLSLLTVGVNIGYTTYPVTASFNLTTVYSGITWSVSRPDLVVIKPFTDGSNAIMVVALVATTTNQPMGTLTGSGSVDGNSFSFTVNLYAYDTVTSIPNYADINISSVNGGYINNLAYRKNGGNWIGMNTISGGGYEPVQFNDNDYVEYMAQFWTTDGHSVVFGQINANGNYASQNGSTGLTLQTQPIQANNNYTVYFYSESYGDIN